MRRSLRHPSHNTRLLTEQRYGVCSLTQWTDLKQTNLEYRAQKSTGSLAIVWYLQTI